ncbi:MAG: outer membrane beta-barrel domain-containing protein [Minicystis sp.]
MNQARVGLLVAAALLAMPATALAQPKGAPAKAAAGAGKKDQGKKDAPADKPADQPVDPPAAASDTPAAAGDSPGALGDICQIDPTACPSIDMDKAAKRNMNEQMYAVQQIYALRYHRFEVNPYFGLTMNDQFVSHPGPGLALNFYITNVLAVGVNGNFYQGLNSVSGFNLQTSRAARVGEPITEYQWNANANFTYVPAYGKFAGFGDFIFHYDFFVLGGVGAISTRPVAVIDPDNRTFTFKPKVDIHVGGGLRIFFNRWLALTLEVSDYIYFEKLENPTIKDGIDPKTGKPFAQDPTTWLADGSFITNNVQAQVGLSIFLPFTWEYRLPK